jgi:hypothetical protein
MKKIREWLSIKVVKSPRSIVLLGVLVANTAFIGVAALVLSWLSPQTIEGSSFADSMFNTIIMYLGIGGIDTVIEDISQADMLLVLSCIIIVIIGLVFFTYVLIGYMSEFISNFIENADSSSKKLYISNHTIILNWNTRAGEIINDLLYKEEKEKIVVLTSKGKDDVVREIDERIANTTEKENIDNKLTIIVREGNTYSTKQLEDISIEQAKSIIILSDGEDKTAIDNHTIKTLIQVSQIIEREDTVNNNRIIVEVEGDQTLALVEKIIKYKKRNGKCNIVPVAVNQILGYIFSQFSIMPELNMVYSTLFSFKGAEFYTWPADASSISEKQFVSEFLENNLEAVPLTIMKGDNEEINCYCMAENDQGRRSSKPVEINSSYRVLLNPYYEIDEKHIIILGHNSKSIAMMEGFEAFNKEWKKNDGSDVLNITIIDDEANLLEQSYYNQYSWASKIISAEIYEQELICSAVSEFVDTYGSGGCILILSDDTLPDEEIDENALTYLVLVQDILSGRFENDPEFNLDDTDLIVEIVDPQNYDIVNNYNMRNVVVSNRYISKLIMQISENKALFDIFQDILTYDEPDDMGDDSKEIYIKRASKFFSELPKPCTAAELIRAVYHSSPDENKSVVLGYFNLDDEMVLFSGDQANINVSFAGNEKLILFSNR